jgi:hypothetical protein
MILTTSGASWALGLLGSWALGFLGTWALGHLGSRAHFKNSCSIVHFISISRPFLDFFHRSRFSTKMAHRTKIGVSYDIINLLTPDFKDCNVDHHNYDNCMFTTMEETMLKLFGCTVPWLPNRSNICTDNSNSSELALDWFMKNRLNQNEICPRNCIFMDVTLGPPIVHTTKKQNLLYAWATLYLKDEVKSTNEYIVYSELSMAAEMGGYLGLLLGNSLVDITYVFSKLIIFLKYLTGLINF